MSGLTVTAVRFAALVQDGGRFGWSGIGVGRAGAADRGALALGNRLLGNPPDAAGIEALLGGVELVADGPVAVAVTGADAPCAVDGRPVARHAPLRLAAGQRLTVGVATAGLRVYVALRGGVAVAPVLGSRSTDTLAGLGPPPLRAGTRLPAGAAAGAWPGVDAAPAADPPAGPLTLAVSPGPRADRLAAGALDRLTGTAWTVSGDSDRVGLRLDGPPLAPATDAPLPSEGLVPGAIQVPPRGRPVLFGPDHPLTGGYPVLAVVAAADLDAAGQARPGQTVRFRLAGRPPPPGPAPPRDERAP